MLSQIQNVSPGFLWQAIALVGLALALVASIATIYRNFKREPEKREIQQPLAVTRGREFLDAELFQRACQETDRRLNSHDAQIDALWNTLRSENEKIRKEMHDGFIAQATTLARIEGKLDKRKE